MLTALLIGLNERRREMAILRSVGARPAQVLALIVGDPVRSSGRRGIAAVAGRPAADPATHVHRA
jgi:hypothetical protein